MFGMEERIRLPNELLYYITKYIDDDTDSFSLALSGTVRGFAEFYSDTRNQDGLIISSRCFFLTPSLWNEFFTTYISPEAITNFSANSCYWLPGNQLCDQIVKMTNLEDLGISDTKVSLPNLAEILKTCKEIIQLELSYQHLPGVENQNNQFGTQPVRDAFKNLTSLKISTAVLNARDYVNDPWIFIIRTLSWCEICTKLTIEITYSGKQFKQNTYEPGATLLSLSDLEVDRHVREDLLPKTDWMKRLQSLSVIKLGFFEDYIFDDDEARCLLLDHLFDRMFSSEPTSPDNLLYLWIHGFHFSLNFVLPIAPSLKAFRVNPFGHNMGGYEIFRDLEHFGGFPLFAPLPHPLKLKTAYGLTEDIEPQEMQNFIREHPNLEQLSVESETRIQHDPNADGKLFKLKDLFWHLLFETYTREMVEYLVKAFPNIQVLCLKSQRLECSRLSDSESLSAIHFPRLTSLSLEEFNLHDGSFLPLIIAQCPKLERIYLDGICSTTSSFTPNLDNFLEKALKLRDFRLQLVSEQKRDIDDAVCILKSLLKCAPNLQRISIEMVCNNPSSDWSFPLADFMVKVALKMERLTCLSITLYELKESKLIEEVNQRMAEEVLLGRPALWFHFSSNFADASDPSVPAVHFHEMIITNNFDPPPKF